MPKSNRSCLRHLLSKEEVLSLPTISILVFCIFIINFGIVSISAYAAEGLCRKFRSDQHFVGDGFGYKADGE